MSNPTSTILVVEDDSIVRMLIVDVLEELEYKVLEAADGGEALSFVQNDAQTIDLMMTDKGLPDIDGVQLAKKSTRAASSATGFVRQRLRRKHRRRARGHSYHR